jgi:hypothetical protein
MLVARMPGPLSSRLRDGSKTAEAIAGRLLTALMRKPTAGWALRRGLLVHGVDDSVELMHELRRYSLAGFADKITCPTFVCNADGDDISSSAPQLVNALVCPKEFVTFTDGEGAGDHCEMGNRALHQAWYTSNGKRSWSNPAHVSDSSRVSC